MFFFFFTADSGFHFSCLEMVELTGINFVNYYVAQRQSTWNCCAAYQKAERDVNVKTRNWKCQLGQRKREMIGWFGSFFGVLGHKFVLRFLGLLYLGSQRVFMKNRYEPNQFQLCHWICFLILLLLCFPFYRIYFGFILLRAETGGSWFTSNPI